MRDLIVVGAGPIGSFLAEKFAEKGEYSGLRNAKLIFFCLVILLFLSLIFRNYIL